MRTGCGSSASCVKGCQIASGLAGILKILRIEMAAKYSQQLLAIDFVEARDGADDGNRAEAFDGPLVVAIPIADHDHAFDGHFCTAQGSQREQSVVDGAERRPRGDQNRKSESPGEIQHEFGIVDGNENAAGAFGNEGPGEISGRLNAREVDADAARFCRQMRRDGWIEGITFRQGLRLRNFREPDDGLAIGALACARLDRLPVNGVKCSNQQRGKQRLADVGVRAGDKKGFVHGCAACRETCSFSRIETSTSAKRARSSLESLAWSEIRRREAPAGTLGGRIGRTPKPASFRSAENRSARSFSPRQMGTICVSPRPISNPASRSLPRKKALSAARSARARSAAATIEMEARICAAIYGGSAVLKIKVRARLTRNCFSFSEQHTKQPMPASALPQG